MQMRTANFTAETNHLSLSGNGYSCICFDLILHLVCLLAFLSSQSDQVCFPMIYTPLKSSQYETSL